MARRRTINPEGQYTLESGSPKDDPTHVSTVIHLMRMRRGTCPVDPERGFPYHEFTKLGDGVERRVEAATRDTLRPLWRPRKITDLYVEAYVARVDGIAVLLVDINFKDKGSEPRVVTLPIARGGG